MKCILTTFFCCVCLNAFAQRSLDLTNTIRIGISESKEYALAQAELNAVSIQSKVVRMRFLPSVVTELIIPNYSRSTTTVTIPDGRDIFVTQNQAQYNANLSVEQNEPWLGGTLAATTAYNRIDIFGNLRSTSYFSAPILFSYTNTNLFARPYLYEKRIDMARATEAVKQFQITLEALAYEIAVAYLEVSALDQQLANNRYNLEELQTIQQIAAKRVMIGTLTRSDQLALEVNALDLEVNNNQLLSQKRWYEGRIKERLAIDGEEVITLQPPGDIVTHIQVPLDVALEKLRANGTTRSTMEMRRFENEQELADLRAKRKISVSVNAFYGLSNTAPTFEGSTGNLQDQQLYTVGLKYRLFDFGRGAQQLRLLEAQRQSINSRYEVLRSAEEREVTRLVQQLSDLQSELVLRNKKVKVVRERFALLKDRFALGSVTVTELSIGQSEVQQAQMQYHQVLKSCWLTYYGIRKLTLYDFENQVDINYLD